MEKDEIKWGRAYEPAVRRTTLRLGHGDLEEAREAVHSVILTLLDTQTRGVRKKAVTQAVAFLATSAVRSYQRSQGMRREVLFSELGSEERRKLFEELPGPALPAAEEAAQRELAALAWRELLKLPPRQRAVLTLRMNGFSYADISRQLGITPGNARVHAHAGLSTLRRRFHVAA